MNEKTLTNKELADAISHADEQVHRIAKRAAREGAIHGAWVPYEDDRGLAWINQLKRLLDEQRRRAQGRKDDTPIPPPSVIYDDGYRDGRYSLANEVAEALATEATFGATRHKAKVDEVSAVIGEALSSLTEEDGGLRSEEGNKGRGDVT